MNATSRGVLLGIGAAALIAASAGSALAGDPKAGPLKIKHVAGGVTWEDQPNEANYHVSGSINYQPPPSCGVDRLRIDAERISLDESLPADTTSFSFPLPNDVRLTFKKDMQLSIEALDAHGDAIVHDGFGFVADPFCPDEEIAAQLAVAGSGSKTPSNGHATVAASLLAVVGLASLGTSVLLRRRAA